MMRVQRAEFSAGLLSICFMVLLGFMDDVLDLRWRYKMMLPPIATLPLLSTYDGPTSMKLPGFIAQLFCSGADYTTLGQLSSLLVSFDQAAHCEIVDLGKFIPIVCVKGPIHRVCHLYGVAGWLFFVFMGLLAVFCTNAINIYAGINGLEAGQVL